MSKFHRIRFACTVLGAIALGACGDVTVPEPAAPALGVGNPSSTAAKATATNIQFGTFALHIPANVHHVRGILLAIGGPDTRGFAVGSPFGAPPPVEVALQELGATLRELAAERGLAILGSGRFGPTAYPNGPASDQLLLAAITDAAALSGRSDLTNAPILMYGISGGGPEATGFVQRNPERILAMFLKVPNGIESMSGEALQVPAYMVLAENDVVISNAVVSASFRAGRAAGAPWAVAVEPGVSHFSLSLAQREVTVDWMRAILPLGNAGPFHQRSPKVGFIGDPATGEIVPSARYTGDVGTSSWFPKRSLAEQWAAFIGM